MSEKLIDEHRMKFENGSASPVVLHFTSLPETGGVYATRVQRTASGEFVHSRFDPLHEALMVRGWNSVENVIWGMEQCGYKRVGVIDTNSVAEPPAVTAGKGGDDL